MEIFEIKDEFIPLNKLLKASGIIDSGGIAKLIIADGLITVDGKVETRKRCKIYPDQIVEYNGQKLKVAKK
ncbi:RNA-binding S4 domain-containing protein [bacterium]|nr:RNA-binding S4 domain-containing protein [bacterium]